MKGKRSHYGRRISKHFGKDLRRWREEASLTLAQAAPKLGLKGKSPGAYLSQIERGKKPVPEVVLLNVARAYNRSAEEVLKKAYHPQLPLPFLTAMMDLNVSWEDVEEYLKETKAEFEDEEKKEIINYATFLLVRRHIYKGKS